MNNLLQVKSQQQSISLYKKMVTALLRNLKFGAITLEDASGLKTYGNLGDKLHATVQIKNYQFYAALFWDGGMGLAESYIHGVWQTDNLTILLQILARNLSVVDQADKSLRGALLRLVANVVHMFKKNNIFGAKRNIAKHYDLGNEFFSLFLDPTMLYSSAIFPTSGSSLEQASLYKLQTICKKLHLQASDHLLEIGTGWGGLAIYAAQNYGCRVTTTTISLEQYNYAQAKVQALGLTDKITLLKQDYRQLTGTYDKIVSIEMIEAVGHQYFAEYFTKCSALVKPSGLFLLQAITIADQRYASARDSVDFIKKHIFPGCCIPSMHEIMKNITRHTDYSLLEVQDLTLDYARTLKAWNQSFQKNIQQVRALAFDEEFIRKWQYYFSYCEAGFLERTIFDLQVVFAKPSYRPENYATY